MRGFFILLAILIASINAAGNFLSIKNGYFYDPSLGTSFIPRGISYQTFNQDIGQWVTDSQLQYDMRVMKLANINSVRVDFAWRDIEASGDGQYTWTNFDYLVNLCEQSGMKIFPLIGYQWPPDWFPGVAGATASGVNITNAGWFSVHPPCPAPGEFITPETYNYTDYWVSDIMSFSNPSTIKKYQEFLAAAATRYKDYSSVAAWIVGNEYGFLGLWSFRYDGYEPASQSAFKTYLTNLYSNNIATLNNVWGVNYGSFNDVVMPTNYNRDDPSWADLTQWRKLGVANLIAQGAIAVRQADPNHLMAYSMVGMIFGGSDWMYECEDNIKISTACREAGAPLDFWAINNYPSSYPGNELRTGTYGIEFAKRTGLPVMYTETGASATDAGFVGFQYPEVRQGHLLRNSAWEAYMNGVIGVHIFTLPDRDYISDREYGFGIVKRYREVKASFASVAELFYQVSLVQQYNPQLFTSMVPAAYDVAFYWPSYAIDQMYCRFQNNMAGVWGPMTRIGLRPRFMNETQLYAGLYKTVQLLILPRNQRMLAGELQFINDYVLPAGVNVYSDADLPGYQDYYARSQPDFMPLMESIFGIQPTVVNAYQDVVTEYSIAVSPYVTLELQPTITMDYLYAYESTWFGVWKYHKVLATSGQVIVNMLIQRENNLLQPGIVMKTHPKAKAIISMFSLGDTTCEALQCWTGHFSYFYSMFLSSQGLNMKAEITVTNSAFLQTQIMNTYNGMKLLYYINWDDYSTTENVQLTIPQIVGMTVKDMLNNRNLISSSSDGVITITVKPNDFGVFLIGEAIAPVVSFNYTLTNVDLFPTLTGSPITLLYDTVNAKSACMLKVQLRATGSNTIFSQIATMVQGTGWTTTNITIRDYDVLSSQYQSTDQGSKNYYFLATLACSGFIPATSTLNVMLSWPVAPKSLPTSITAGTPITTTLLWENLPINRLNAFQGDIAVWNSSKTQAMDPTHYAKVQAVVKQLESMGYLNDGMTSWDQGLQSYGPLYHVFNDTDPTSVMCNFDPGYWGEYVKYIILPGVTVLSTLEAKNIRTWVLSANFTDVTLISTEGGVGRYDENGNYAPERMADLFGMGTPCSTAGFGANGGLQLNFNNLNHPLTFILNSSSNSYSNAAVGAAGSSYIALSSTAPGKPLATIQDAAGTDYPAFITNQLSNWGKALVMNFDITQSTSIPQTLIWTQLVQWMRSNALIYKTTFMAQCNNQTVASTDMWNILGTGSQTITLNPTGSCSGKSLTFQGYVYYWNVTTPTSVDKNLGYYSSANDGQAFKVSSDATTRSFQWLLTAACFAIVLILVQ